MDKHQLLDMMKRNNVRDGLLYDQIDREAWSEAAKTAQAAIVRKRRSIEILSNICTQLYYLSLEKK